MGNLDFVHSNMSEIQIIQSSTSTSMIVKNLMSILHKLYLFSYHDVVIHLAVITLELFTHFKLRDKGAGLYFMCNVSFTITHACISFSANTSIHRGINI